MTPSKAIGEKLCERDRPSRHGQILGRAIAKLAGDDCTGRCITCAFTEGTMPNQMAATGLDALRCAIGVDPDRFACHHGMADGQPTRLCVGYLQALETPFEKMREILGEMHTELDAATGPDEVRAEFDRWAAECNRDGKLDDYALARAFARRARSKSQTEEEER